MTLIARQVSIGVIKGTVYTFEKAGDVFPEHVHTDADNHITVPMFGRVRCTGHPAHDGLILEPKSGGPIKPWTAGQPHGFIAETDGASIFNVRIA